MQASPSYGTAPDRIPPPSMAVGEALDATAPRRTPVDTAAVLADLPAAVVVVDRRGTVAMVNAAAETLLGPGIVGRSWREVVEGALESSAPPTVRLRSGRLVEVTTQPQADGLGQIVLLVDVTPSRLAEAFDRRHERLADLGRMLSGIAHQLRTPLATAGLQIAALERDHRSGDAVVVRRIASLRQSHRRLERTVEDLLAFARGGALPMSRLEVDPWIDDFLQSTAPRCAASGVRLSVDRRCHGAVVESNAAALAGVLDNLVDNALQAFAGRAGREGPARILLTVERLGLGRSIEAIGLCLADNGPGIDPAIHPHLFEPFRSGRTGGTGLGLTVARLVVEAHQGTIEAASAPGGGAVFSIRLPVLPAGRGDV